ncbi:MAG: hypothetical protein ACTSPS_06300 [Promethearchaeota archaeon]
MENIAIIDIIKKFVIFICISISVIILMLVISAIFGLSYLFIMSLDVYFIMILTMVLIAVVAKYLGDIAIVALKSKRE